MYPGEWSHGCFLPAGKDGTREPSRLEGEPKHKRKKTRLGAEAVSEPIPVGDAEVAVRDIPERGCAEVETFRFQAVGPVDLVSHFGQLTPLARRKPKNSRQSRVGTSPDVSLCASRS